MSSEDLTVNNICEKYDDIHLINDVDLFTEDSLVAVVEIPSGTTEKWEVDKETGNLNLEYKNSKPRKIDFLAYPANYGFLPQTVQGKEAGGDGDPLDIVILFDRVQRCSIVKIKILGRMQMVDNGEKDDKYIGILEGTKLIKNIKDFDERYPGALSILKLWFQSYKNNRVKFIQLDSKEISLAAIKSAHKDWKQLVID